MAKFIQASDGKRILVSDPTQSLCWQMAMNHTNLEKAMKLRNILLAIGFFIGTSSAVAVPLTPSIPGGASIRFSFAGWNETTTQYLGNCGTIPGFANAPACDANTAIPARNGQMVNPPYSGGSAEEDGWGVLRVTSIEGNGIPFYSNPIGNGTHISAFFYHLVDGIVIVDPTTT